MSNIKSHSSEKTIAILQKPKSPLSIVFTQEDPEDDWTINLYKFKTKTGEITYECGIIKPDLESHINFYLENGYYKV